jgi:hypothetical protein
MKLRQITKWLEWQESSIVIGHGKLKFPYDTNKIVTAKPAPATLIYEVMTTYRMFRQMSIYFIRRYTNNYKVRDFWDTWYNSELLWTRLLISAIKEWEELLLAGVNGYLHKLRIVIINT